MHITSMLQRRRNQSLAQNPSNVNLSKAATSPTPGILRKFSNHKWCIISAMVAILLTTTYRVVYRSTKTPPPLIGAIPALKPILTISASQSIPLNSKINLHTPELPSGISTEPTFVNGRQILAIGPVELEVIDQNGNRTGLRENDTVELNAADTSYTEVGETKAIFVRGSGIYTVNIKANEPGIFDLRLRTVRESEVERFVHFADVPLSSTYSTARLIYSADAERHTDVLELDQDGDGVYDTTVLPTSDIEGDAD